MFFIPIQMGTYSPFSSFIYDIMPSPAPTKPQCYVSGDVLLSNGTKAINIQIKLYGTDDMREEFVVTDENGYFISNLRYSTGQVIAVSYNNKILIPRFGELFDSFITYDAVDNSIIYLGEFIVVL